MDRLAAFAILAFQATATLSLIGAVPTPAAAADADGNPVVVELFTSQGCSSCPPANANLTAISTRPDVLALSFGVTYWDYLGWKDSFASPDFTQRQYNYERSLHRATAYTPQMVVNGAADLVGNSADELDRFIAAAKRDASAPATRIALAADAVSLSAGTAPADPADVWLVRYDPNIVEVPIARGENGGRTLPHKNVVHELVRLGTWTGDAARFELPAAAASGLKTAILVQSAYAGPILAAATD
jgi:hypothetical protein